MLTLYVMCLLVGGALVALSIFAGGDADLDADVDGSEVSAVGARSRLLSVRSVVFFVAFFGLTGTVFSMLGVGGILTPPFAIAIGFTAAGTVHYVMGRLGDSEAGEVDDSGALEGTLATVIVAIDDTHTGKVAVRNGARTLQLVARVHRDAETRRFPPGEEVVIVELADGIAHVAGTRFLA